MLKINEKGNNINLSKDQKNKGLRLTQRKVESKDLGNISMDLSKEEEIMKKTPGLMENSMIENITAMNSIFEQKQSERLMLNNLNKLNKINDSNNDINNSNQTLTNLVGNTTSNSNNNENPLDVAVIIKDSQEVIDEEKKKENKKRKKRKRKKKKKKYNISIILIVILMVIILILIIGLVKTYLSLSN